MLGPIFKFVAAQAVGRIINARRDHDRDKRNCEPQVSPHRGRGCWYAEARAEVGKMMRINPGITLQAWRLAYSFRDPAILDRYSLDLVQAGVPQTERS
jgi:hypothetical protein